MTPTQNARINSLLTTDYRTPTEEAEYQLLSTLERACSCARPMPASDGECQRCFGRIV